MGARTGFTADGRRWTQMTKPLRPRPGTAGVLARFGRVERTRPERLILESTPIPKPTPEPSANRRPAERGSHPRSKGSSPDTIQWSPPSGEGRMGLQRRRNGRDVGGMNRSGRCGRCVVVVQGGVPCGEFPLAPSPYRRVAGTPDPGRSRAPRRLRSRRPSKACLVRSPLLRFPAAIPRPTRTPEASRRIAGGRTTAGSQGP